MVCAKAAPQWRKSAEQLPELLFVADAIEAAVQRDQIYFIGAEGKCLSEMRDRLFQIVAFGVMTGFVIPGVARPGL